MVPSPTNPKLSIAAMSILPPAASRLGAFLLPAAQTLSPCGRGWTRSVRVRGLVAYGAQPPHPPVAAQRGPLPQGERGFARRNWLRLVILMFACPLASPPARLRRHA